ncbi:MULTISPECIES: PRC-barrel domain-containing protein [unclassified Nitrobacter]|uniref:PRC-barrel domain-containing protein n=1 Tax=unclassified Nitrobacter TaxID=2620411 RepID=UPI000926D1D9|nr:MULTISPECIES: PRC-barrel domain-containing protein [unclassified Nitrobacter]MBN9146661.1 PRC-barrel domain-containing protein [Nitrobacter sp.]OJV02551.1 MAG: photosystem reaction center subunit H [Nitrobacter sp. 62-23]
MIAKHITVALIGSALLATAAVAQTPGSTNTMSAPAATSSESGYHGDWRSSKMIGLNVYNDSNEKLGSISDMLLDKSGKINAAVIGVGGFLGVGEHLVAVSFDKLKFVDTPVPSTSTSSTSGGTTTGTTTGSTTSTSTTSKSNPWYPDHVVFSATKEQLKSMPEFKYSE